MNFEKILRKFVTWGIFFVPFIPLIVSSTLFFPFITGKNFAFRIIVELLFGGWIALMFYDRSYRPRFSWLLASVVAFVGIIAVADITGENPLKSIWSNFERMEGLIALVHLLMYFLVAGSVLNTEKLWTRFFNTSVFVSGLLGLYGFFQLLGRFDIHQGSSRLDATLGNATYLAVYMLFHVFITVFLLSRWKGSRYVSYIYTGLIALQVMMIYFTATRGTILGLLGGVTLAGILTALFGGRTAKNTEEVGENNNNLRKIAIGAIIGVLVIVSGFFLIKNTDFAKNSPVLSRFTGISLSEGTVQARFLIWSVAMEGVKERPLLGWGQENFNFVFNKYYKPELYAQEQWFDRVHNFIFDWLISGGILGLLAYISMFFTTLFYLWRKKNTFFSINEKSIFTGLLAGYTFHNLFVFDNLISSVFFFTIMAFVYWAYKESTRVVYMEDIEDDLDKDIISHIYVPIIIILTLFSVYIVNNKGILTARTLVSAISIPVGHPDQIDLFKKALSYNSFGNQEIREQIGTLSTRITGSNLDITIKQAYLTFSVEEMQKQLEKVENDARTQIFTGTLLDSFGQYDAASVYINRANELSPKKPTILFQLGLNALNRGDTAGALEIFKRAYNLAPKYIHAQIFYAVGAIYAKDEKLLEEILVPVYGSVIVDNDRLLQAYFNNKQFDRVIAIWQLRIEKDSKNVQAHLGLAATYLNLNRRVEAVQEVQYAIDIDENFKEQGEFLIREIEAGRNP